jgi:ABC-type multidrug transport system ATPase subunit
LTDAKDVCDRVAILSRGQIEAIGTLQELLATPGILRCIGDMLPQTTAERVLQIIRQDLDAPYFPDKISMEPLKENSLSESTKPTAGLSDKARAASDALLAPLMKVAAPSPTAANESIEINHDLLAALTRSVVEDSPPALQAKPKSPKTPDADET